MTTAPLEARERSAVYRVLQPDAKREPFKPWRWCRVGDLGRYVNGRAFKPTEWEESGLPIIRIQNLNDPDAKFNYSTANHDERFRVRTGDLLMSWAASLGVYIWRRGNAWLNQHTFRVEVNESLVTKEYLFYALTASIQSLYAKSHGSGMVHVTKGVLEDHLVRLPSLDDQRAIVGYLDEQLSRLDASVAALLRAQANLKRYRASVLKAACEGRLVPTEAELAKLDGRDFETGGQLLQRILIERVSRSSGTRKHRPPVPIDGPMPFESSEGWTWGSVDQLASPESNSITDGPFGSNLRSADYTESGPRVIRLQNIKEGEFADEHAHITDERFDRLAKHRVFADDVVIATLGESPPRACLIPSYVGPAIVKADCIRFKPHWDVLPAFAILVLNAEPTRKRVKGLLHGVGRPRLSLGEIRAIALPLAPLAEQHRIVAEADRRLSLIRAAEAQVTANLARAKRLRQSILQAAFSAPTSGA